MLLGWLTDNCIYRISGLFMQMFKTEFPASPKHVFIAAPTFFTRGLPLILNYLLAHWIPGMRSKDGPFCIRPGTNDIFLPVHLNGNHWALIFVKGQWKTIYYYDSMWQPHNGSKYLRATLHVLMEMVVHQWESADELAPWLHDFDLDEWKLVDLGKAITQQPNTCDCGVYVCYYIFVLMFASPRHYHVVIDKKNSMDGFRRKLCRLLFDRTLNMDSMGFAKFLSL
jgi:Ulp1 protease family, C-terminal catalytic domain